MNTNTTHETNILKSSRKTPEPAHFCNGIKRTAEKIQKTQINSTNKLRKVSEQQGVTYGIDDSRKEGKLQKLKMLLLDEDCKEFLQNLIAKKVDLLLHEKNIVPAPTKFESVVENCRVLERHFKNWGVFSNSLQERVKDIMIDMRKEKIIRMQLEQKLIAQREQAANARPITAMPVQAVSDVNDQSDETQQANGRPVLPTSAASEANVTNFTTEATINNNVVKKAVVGSVIKVNKFSYTQVGQRKNAVMKQKSHLPFVLPEKHAVRLSAQGGKHLRITGQQPLTLSSDLQPDESSTSAVIDLTCESDDDESQNTSSTNAPITRRLPPPYSSNTPQQEAPVPLVKPRASNSSAPQPQVTSQLINSHLASLHSNSKVQSTGGALRLFPRLPENLSQEESATELPPRFHLGISKEMSYSQSDEVQRHNGGENGDKVQKSEEKTVLSWDNIHVPKEVTDKVSMYELYACHASTPGSGWNKIGNGIKALRLPMACTMTQFSSNNTYFFAVRAKDSEGRVGPFSNVCCSGKGN